MGMDRDASLEQVHHLRVQLSATVKAQDDYAERYLDLTREAPSLLGSGEMDALRRYARDAEHYAHLHRQALEDYCVAVIARDSGLGGAAE
ncbi:MAG: hypothetical protein HY874_01225 [Chloroflexi bacterium]|nr:hypothetical protein [Chloroflexota bacterium]